MSTFFRAMLIIGVLLSFVSCASHSEKVYVGSSSDKAIIRVQDGDKVQCSSKEFDQFLCLPKADLIDLIKSCK